MVRQRRRHAAGAARFLSLAVGADRAAGGGLCRPAVLPLGLARACARGAQHGRADQDRHRSWRLRCRWSRRSITPSTPISTPRSCCSPFCSPAAISTRTCGGKTRAVAGNLAALKAETATKFVGADEISDVPIAAHPARRYRAAAARRALGGRWQCDRGPLRDRPEPDHRRDAATSTAEPGTPVYAGTLNRVRRAAGRVAAAAEGTLLAEISRLLENALQARSRYLQLADRASRLYAPVVHAAALLTMLGWVLSARAGTMPSSPRSRCSSSPVPARSGSPFRRCRPWLQAPCSAPGVLLNSGDAIERVADVDPVVFDKTGTLTLPELDVVNAADIPADVFELAGRLALSSRHPVAARSRAPSARNRRWPGSRGARAGRARHARRRRGQARQPVLLRCRRAGQRNSGRDPEASVVAFRHGEAVPCLRGAAAPAPRCGRRRSPRCKARGIAVEMSVGRPRAGGAHAAEALGVDEWRAGVTPARQDRAYRGAEAARPQGDDGRRWHERRALAGGGQRLDVAGQRHASQPGHRRSGIPRRATRAGGRRRSTSRARRCG